jgi:redox-sensitive bicupin YhaK (pirin superfamily)
MGNGTVILPGEVQRMSAGTGIRHSEKNSSEEQDVHLLQIWIIPEEQGLTPSYEQKMFEADEKRGRLRLIASNDGRDGSVTVHQDANLYAALLEAGEEVTHQLSPERHAWAQVARGAVELNGQLLQQGDGAAVSGETQLQITGRDAAEILLFDLG